MRTLRLATLLSGLMMLGGIQSQAATLFGKVIEVTEGDLIRVMNMKREVKIRLIGANAPEKNQEFGDIARQHLSDLVLGQNVVVEYMGMGHDGTLVGRVVLNEVDMNAQMIRDGAAWFDPSSKGELAEEKREIYFQSEQAARNEKRGLWQTGNPIAPWEFIKAEESKRQLVGRTLSINEPKPARPRTELTSESLIRTGSTSANVDMKWISGESRGWDRFHPNGESFSAMVPTGGKLSREPIPFGDTYVDMNYYVVKDEASVYTMMWTTGPETAESDSSVIKSILVGFLRGVGAGYEKLGGQFSCTPNAGSDISTGGFTGRSFNLTGCTVPAAARVFTKAGDGKRQVYLGAVFYGEKDENVDRFIQSFTTKSVEAPKSQAKDSK